MSATNNTPGRQFRLGPDTLADLDRIKDYLGLRSRAEAIRAAAREYARRLGRAEKKSQENPA